MIILPTMYRRANLERFVKSYQQTGASLPVWVILDWNNYGQYAGMSLPDSFKVIRVSSGARVGEIFNNIFRYYPKEDFYGIMADDVVPETYRWDILLKEACSTDKIAWGFDGGHDETLPRHPFIGGDLVRKMGFLCVPGLKHWYVDDGWRDIATGLDCGVYRPEIRMVHHHPTVGLSSQDRTYSEQPDPRTDEIRYRKWHEKELPKLIERLRAA